MSSAIPRVLGAFRNSKDLIVLMVVKFYRILRALKFHMV